MLPLALMENEAVCPAVTVRFTGWLVIEGAETVGAGAGAVDAGVVVALAQELNYATRCDGTGGCRYRRRRLETGSCAGEGHGDAVAVGALEDQGAAEGLCRIGTE